MIWVTEVILVNDKFINKISKDNCNLQEQEKNILQLLEQVLPKAGLFSPVFCFRPASKLLRCCHLLVTFFIGPIEIEISRPGFVLKQVYSGRRNWSTGRKTSQTWGEHANATQTDRDLDVWSLPRGTVWGTVMFCWLMLRGMTHI